MLDTTKEIWNYVIATPSGGGPITVGQIVSVILLLFIGYLGSKFVGYLLGRRLANTKLRPDVVFILKRIAFFFVIIFVIMTALGLLGIPLTAFAFATGAIAIGVGFGAQNIINNFISGWILMAERPIRIDDFIEIDSTYGTVEVIGNRSTRIRRADGVHMLVPNSQLLERTVVNWTLIDQEVRTTLRVGVAYGSPVRKVAELILQAVTEQPEVKSEPLPSVVFEDFGDNSLVFDSYFWCDVGGERALRQIRSAVRFRICDLFEESNIVIAFPQRDVHLDTNKPLEIRVMPESQGAAESGPET
jgi:small-conductance mechanosensitive channel